MSHLEYSWELDAKDRQIACLIASKTKLREALEQVLDDMGEHGLSVCEDTKTMVRTVLEADNGK